MRKGQVELIVILGLLVVIAVVVVSQLNIFAPTETTDSRLARESVEAFIRIASYDTVERMSLYGGYLSPDDFATDYVILNGKPVPYWQKGGTITYPDKTANFVKGVKDYIDENKDGLAATMTNVTLGEPVVSSPLFNDDSITVTVALPTVIRGVPYNQPYVVTIPTRFSEAYEFSKNFVQYEATERPLEYFTLSSMFLSPLENGFHEIPYAEVATNCGEYLFTSSLDVKPKVENVIRTTLAYTYMPGRVPLNTLKTTSHPKYSMSPINGNSYPNIDLSFDLPDDFELLLGSDFQMDPDTVTIIAEPVPLTGACMSDPADISYFVRYPTVVRVRDPETNNMFQFAVDVYIKDNLPGEWAGGVTGYETDEQREVCEEAYCDYSITVTDLSGGKVSGASVKYMGCYLGRTDSDGKLSGLGPCGLGMLRMSAKGFDDYNEFVSYDDLVDGTFSMRKRVSLNFEFYEVIVSEGVGGGYFISADSAQVPGISPLQDSLIMMNFMSLRNSFDLLSAEPAMAYNILVEDTYAVSGTLLSPDMTKLEGAFVDQITLSYTGGDAETVYVYIPRSINFNGATEQQAKVLAATYTGVLQACGIGPISTERVTLENSCAVDSI
jgi:hypothetical protein